MKSRVTTRRLRLVLNLNSAQVELIHILLNFAGGLVLGDYMMRGLVVQMETLIPDLMIVVSMDLVKGVSEHWLHH